MAVMVALRIQNAPLLVPAGEMKLNVAPLLDATIILWSMYAFFMVLAFSEDVVGKTVSEMARDEAKMFLLMDFVFLATLSFMLALIAFPKRFPLIMTLAGLGLLSGGLMLIMKFIVKHRKEPVKLNFGKKIKLNALGLLIVALALVISAMMYLPESYLGYFYFMGVAIIAGFFIITAKKELKG